MGNLCSGSGKHKKKRAGSLIKIKNQNDNCYYKPKPNSASLICYDPEKKTIREELLDTKTLFRPGCMFSKLGPCLYLCIGGSDTSDSAFIIHLNEKKVSSIPSPPCSLSYGHLNKYKDKIYVIGALTIDGQGSYKPAQPHVFDLKTKKWSELPEMPQQVALSGSYIVHTYLYLIGGYLDYPNNPNPFNYILIYDISSECWVESDIQTPIQGGMPNCTVLPSFDILIIGGYDPLDVIKQDSRNVFLFDGKTFEQCAELPAVGKLRFFDDAMNFRSDIYIYSDENALFIYNIDKDSWSYHNLEFKGKQENGESLQVSKQSSHVSRNSLDKMINNKI